MFFMKMTVLLLFSISTLSAFAQDGVWITPENVDPRYVHIKEGFKIVGEKVHIARVSLDRNGVREVSINSPALNETPVFLNSSNTESVDPVARTKHFYCDTSYASARWIGDTLEVKKFTLRKEVMFLCPRSKSMDKRGLENGPMTENTYILSNLNEEPTIESTTKNANFSVRGFDATPTISSQRTNTLIRIAP